MRSKHKSVEYNSQVIYCLPTSVSSLLNKYLEKYPTNKYLSLYQYENFYEIVVCEFSERGVNYFARNTNHRVFIDGKLIPLVMETDMIFGVAMDSVSLFQRFLDKDFLLDKEYLINEGYSIKFKQSGEILDNVKGVNGNGDSFPDESPPPGSSSE
ncbi:MAG: hypothetical protein KF880_02785 [Ferruginibacter sp.]|nr:hypothetical protein [Ferruginibacter sp.]